ncbi:helix-turn-helix domain-containing protein [Symbiobacterium terraclitae]|uniref:helix-turn-helix domain-containing protein n=1 Tax=Symbiobacterium terraclitae TaxID=557451 RepID=UPI0035B5386C
MNQINRQHIGKRIAALRAAHGDSLRQAAARTGVSHTTVGRLEAGQFGTSLNSTLRKIAEGYGVTVEYLLTGRDPQHDFQSSLRKLPPEERNRLYFASPATRIRMLLQFLMAEYPAEFPLDRLAARLELSPESLQRLVEGGDDQQLSPEEVRRLGEQLAKVTAIPLHWFLSGDSGELAAAIPPEMLGAYVRLIKKAAEAGVRPDLLEMAVDLLILKHREMPAGHPPSSGRRGG